MDNPFCYSSRRGRIRIRTTTMAVFQILTIFTWWKISIAEELPPLFIFGDSLVDSGNNNYIRSLSKANYVPNGIDFGKPTGRYTNGRTIPDILGNEVGLKGFIPPFLEPTTKGSVLLHGVNYASGGGGILNSTGKIFIGRINLDAQLDNFANNREDIISAIGVLAASKLFENSLFSVTIGANDFINNYLLPIISKIEQKFISPEAFVTAMISKFRLQLIRLYEMGARKVLIANVGPIGCIPYLREINPSSGEDCVVFPNQIAEMFNNQLRTLLNELSSSLKGSEFVYADVYRIFGDIIQNYLQYGFVNANSACCHVAGRFGGLIPCGPRSKVCEERSKYVFWDPYHPSEAANVLIAKRLLDGETTDIWPINIRQLLAP